jgi:hypothetical protein
LVIDNTILQSASSFHRGQYALADLLHYPTNNVMVGGEFQWGRRRNFGDGFRVNDYRLQFSFRFNFSAVIAGTP